VRAELLRAGTIEELKSKGRLVVRGAHRPILVVEDRGRIFALDAVRIWASHSTAGASRTAF
jgi:nitrite reductase/ring-hydroxylating ferredoxin subunit